VYAASYEPPASTQVTLPGVSVRDCISTVIVTADVSLKVSP
jgi:hypothetical protein